MVFSPPPWWLCPNEPRCPHGRILHDDNGEGDVPTCCVEGCPCGHEA
jgi:hypothetical protein